VCLLLQQGAAPLHQLQPAGRRQPAAASSQAALEVNREPVRGREPRPQAAFSWHNSRTLCAA
jgi:hypothetical protein